MNGLKALVFVVILAASSVAKAEDAPLYFDALTKDTYILVVLRQDGKAEFLRRETRSDGTTSLLHDDAATWGYVPGQPKNVRPNVWIKTKQFRFDYFLEEERLTEIDKMGVQSVLTKRRNTNPQAQ